jgi:H+/Cl- antiporter ClcA
MQSSKDYRPNWPAMKRTLRWCGLAFGPAILTGFLTTLLIKLVDREQQLRSAQPWLFLLLPLGAIAIYLFQRPFPQKALPLALPGLHEIERGISRHSIPFIYVSTLLTHLFGASAGREGASFQAGVGIGQEFAGWYDLDTAPRQIIISACVASAFAALFGTPIAAAVFALELTRIERFPYNALVPCGVGGLAGLGVAAVMGMHNSQFKYLFSHALPISFNGPYSMDIRLLLVTVGLGIILGLVCCAFTELSRQVRYLGSWIIQPAWVMPLFASVVLALLGYFTPARDYMGLGILPTSPSIPSILSAFQPGELNSLGWLWKMALTLLTFAAGFRGGEIVPLLFIGTILAHFLAPFAGVNLTVFCSLAFVGIFAAAANTPIAGIFLSVELFGSQYIVYFAFCSLIAYFLSPLSGTRGKFSARGIPKLFTPNLFPHTSWEDREKN